MGLLSFTYFTKSGFSTDRDASYRDKDTENAEQCCILSLELLDYYKDIYRTVGYSHANTPVVFTLYFTLTAPMSLLYIYYGDG